MDTRSPTLLAQTAAAGRTLSRQRLWQIASHTTVTNLVTHAVATEGAFAYMLPTSRLDV